MQRVPLRNSVLVVDDDPSMRRGIMRLLRIHGFNSTLFDSANAILDHDDFDDAFCIIMDIDLNGVSGIEVCQRLAGMGIGLPIIFITGNDSDAVHTAATEIGCLAYLTKPFEAVSLIKPLEEARAAA